MQRIYQENAVRCADKRSGGRLRNCVVVTPSCIDRSITSAFHCASRKLSNKIMSSAATSAPAPAAAPTTNAAGKRICCVCKDTKKVRDECIFQFGEEKCQEPIELHKVCLRSEGFDIQ